MTVHPSPLPLVKVHRGWPGCHGWNDMKEELQMKKPIRVAAAALGLVLGANVYASAAGPSMLQASTDPSSTARSVSDSLVFSEDFEGSPALSLHGSASVQSGTLVLDGSNGGYAQLDETSFFNDQTGFTVSFDVQTQTASGNFFTFALGQDNIKYLFLRTRSSEFYVGLTQNSWNNESGVVTTLDGLNQWKNVTIALSEDTLSLYIDGVL